MFEKKETIYKKKDRETWNKIRLILKAAGIKVSARHYLQETLIAGGCGSKLDPRDFGPKGKADREIYVISVRKADAPKALEIIRENGLHTEVMASVWQMPGG